MPKLSRSDANTPLNKNDRTKLLLIIIPLSLVVLYAVNGMKPGGAVGEILLIVLIVFFILFWAGVGFLSVVRKEAIGLGFHVRAAGMVLMLGGALLARAEYDAVSTILFVVGIGLILLSRFLGKWA